MLLTLVRHVQAEEALPGAPDADRALTPRGQRRLRTLRRGLRRLDLGWDSLSHSPWRRAHETAAGLARLVAGPVRAEPLLASPPGPALLARIAGERPALVGHQPWLGELLAWLVHGERSAGAGYDWRKGGVAVLRGEPVPHGMRLAAFLPPRLLREIAGP